MSRILVTDGEERSALAVVRSLGRAGHRVTVCSPQGRPLAGASRHASDVVRVPDPLTRPEACADALADACRRRRADVLIPVTEASLRAVLPRREAFGSTRIPYPAAETFAAVSDKRVVLDRARELGIAVPSQHVLGAAGELSASGAPDVEFPVVVKPSRSVVETTGIRRKTGVRHVRDRRALEDALAALPTDAFPVLLQQRIEGTGVGVFLLIWEGELLARFAHRRIREKPPSGGVSVYRESVAADEDLVGVSLDLLASFGWEGVAMVEYKVDDASGTPYLMEVNGRFWGSLQLAVDAGVDFPALLVSACLGAGPEPVTAYRPGVRLRWLWGDVDHLLARLRHSPEALSLPAGAPGRLAAVRDFLAAWRPGTRTEVFRPDDPVPFLRESLAWARSASGRASE